MQVVIFVSGKNGGLSVGMMLEVIAIAGISGVPTAGAGFQGCGITAATVATDPVGTSFGSSVFFGAFAYVVLGGVRVAARGRMKSIWAAATTGTSRRIAGNDNAATVGAIPISSECQCAVLLSAYTEFAK